MVARRATNAGKDRQGRQGLGYNGIGKELTMNYLGMTLYEHLTVPHGVPAWILYTGIGVCVILLLIVLLWHDNKG